MAPVQVIFVGQYRQTAQRVFNGNAYPAYARPVVDACASRYALLLLHALSTRRAIQYDISEFRRVMEAQRLDLETAVAKRPDLSVLAIYDGLPHMAQMHSALNALKSFLDLYAKLLGKLVTPSNSWTFDKAVVDGEKVSGGRLVKAIRGTRLASLQPLADLILANSRSWITEAVTYRDQLSHRSELDAMRRLQLPINPTPPHFDFGALSKPAMPNGQELDHYLESLVTGLATFVGRSVKLFPSVDLKLISPDRLLTSDTR